MIFISSAFWRDNELSVNDFFNTVQGDVSVQVVFFCDYSFGLLIGNFGGVTI
ncbi:hypothetical protein ACI76W_06630 [Capnocytophaga canimorsus]|uniref:hypothetical protein n=1 Tax=Capnocytophaga canimorsus TaxID=28188 RepID=UPI003858A9CF